MVSKCMNSHCSAKFQYLGQGRLFCVEFAAVENKSVSPANNAVAPIGGKEHSFECFWLCARCASTMTIEPGDAGAVRVVPLHGGAAVGGKTA